MAVKVFTGIGSLLSMAGVRRKDGRHVQAEDLGIVSNASVVVENRRIKWVGPSRSLPKEFRKAKQMDMEGRTVLPGFVECHTHTVFSGSRANEFEMRLQGKSYQEIAQQGGGIQSTVEATRKASVRELLVLAQERVDRFRAQGVTTLEIKSGYGLNHAGEIKILETIAQLKGVRIVPTYLGPHAIPKNQSKDAYLPEILDKTLPTVRKKKLARRVDMFVEQNYFTIEDARAYAKRAHELGFDLVLHADQLSRTGAGVLGAELNARSVDHLVQISDADARRLATSNTTAVLLPAADLYMKMKYPPARKLIDSGARVALATDFNPGSSPTQDLNLVGLLARVEMGMSLPEVIAAYTYNAACALGLEDQTGAIGPGLAADLIAVDGDWRDLFYQAGSGPKVQVL